MLRSLAVLTIVVALTVLASQASARCVGMSVTTAAGEGRSGEACASDHIKVPDGKHKTYRVGPGQQFTRMADVPWNQLVAGDTVYIHHRAEPYREKILLSGRGSPTQWIRILGVPGPNGELPVISGDEAVTAKNMPQRWRDPKLVEWLGVVQVVVGPDVADRPPPLPPAYIEIANLQVQDGFSTYRFRAWDGTWLHYNGFAACIYARSAQHIVVRNNVLTNCGQGFYNWTGDGSSPSWWAAVQSDTVLSGNHFYNNGNPDSYLEHQVYVESDGMTVEYNRFGPQRAGAKGSQLKDRSIGTVIRYNVIEQSRSGWDLDLVEPEESWPVFGRKPQFGQTFVYGNLIVSRFVDHPNIVHWNEDHQAGHGRAARPGSTLFAYHNTVVIFSDRRSSEPYTIFNATWGGYDCPPSDLPGVIDARNNIFAVLPVRPGAKVPAIRLGYCGKEKISLGANWISPGFLRGSNVEVSSDVVSPANNDPGFRAVDDFRLRDGASAAGAGKPLASPTEDNSLGAGFPAAQLIVDPSHVGPRRVQGQGSDLGAQ